MPRKKLTKEQKAASKLTRTKQSSYEESLVSLSLLSYIREERQRSGLSIKEVYDKARRLQEEGSLPQYPGKKGYKP